MADHKQRAELAQRSRQLNDSPTLRQLADELRRFAQSPSIQKLQEPLRRLRESPNWQQRHRELDTLVRRLREGPEQPRRTKKKRKKGAGAKLSLDNRTVTKLQRRYRQALRRDRKLSKHDAAVAELRPLLPEAKRNISSRTIVRLIVSPVLNLKE
jgi:hypothetical protein